MPRPSRVSDYWQFVVDNVATHPHTIVAELCKQFSISRQAANKYFQTWIDEGRLRRSGHNQKPCYQMAARATGWMFDINNGLDVHRIWKEQVQPSIAKAMPKPLQKMLFFALQTVITQAQHHSQGDKVMIKVHVDADRTGVWVCDNGLGLSPELLDVLQELACDTHFVNWELFDPSLQQLAGWLDSLCIHSGQLCISQQRGQELQVFVEPGQFRGTATYLELAHDRQDLDPDELLSQTVSHVALQGLGQSVAKTVIHVYPFFESPYLYTQEEAHKLVPHLKPFQQVVLDFEHIEFISEEFAYELFSNITQQLPWLRLLPLNLERHLNHVVMSTVLSYKAS